MFKMALVGRAGRVAWRRTASRAAGRKEQEEQPIESLARLALARPMEMACAPFEPLVGGEGADGATVGVVATMPSRRPRRTRLRVEPLETRDTPSDGPWAVETFDSGAVGSHAPGWAAWGSDGDPGI